jgi:hypothetical protein
MRDGDRNAQPRLSMWFTSTVVVGLAPLIVCICARAVVDGTVALPNALGCGVLTFYGYGIAAQLLWDNLGAIPRLLELKRAYPGEVNYSQSIWSILYRCVVPLSVCWMSARCFWRVLGPAKRSELSISELSLMAALLAVLSSLEHSFWLRTLLRTYAKNVARNGRSGMYDDR